MRKILIILTMAALTTGCAVGRDVGRFVESTIISVPQKVSPIGSSSRGANLVKVYPSGEYAISRDRKFVAIDGFSSLAVAQEYTEGSTDYSVLSGTTHEGESKSIIFVSPSSVQNSGFFEIPRTSSKPFEIQKSGRTIQFIQESESGDAFIVSSIDSATPKNMKTAMVPKADVRPAVAALEPPASPYLDKQGTKAPAAATKPSTAPAQGASAKPKTYGIELPPLDAYTSVKVDRAGKAKVDTATAPATSKAKPQLVLD